MFNPRIFRDMQNVDYHKTPMTVIFRVLRYGDMEDIAQIRHIYNIDVLTRFVDSRGYRLDAGEHQLLGLIISKAKNQNAHTNISS